MNSHRYILEKGSKKYLCPDCGKKTFVRYVDTDTNNYLPEQYGRCDRESKCGYHYTPKQCFKDNQHLFDTPQSKQPKTAIVSRPTSYISVDILKKSCNHYDKNNFINYLLTRFDTKQITFAVEKYFIGTSNHWPGATMFWQIDNLGKIRTGKIMVYDPGAGHRIKKPYNHITWAHSVLKIKDYNLKQCLFGEHLLKAEPSKPVAVVESEKTAIIASVYFPQFLWLAVGSLNNLSAGKCQALKGRKVTLFPDLNGFDKWSSKAKGLSYLASFNVSDLLERKATKEDKEQGLDLADYLVKQDYREFRSSPIKEINHPINTQSSTTTTIYKKGESPKNIDTPLQQIKQRQNEKQVWNVIELEHFFNSNKTPLGSINLSEGVKVTDIQKFIDSHLEIVKAQNGKPIYRPYYERLKQLRETLTTTKN